MTSELAADLRNVASDSRLMEIARKAVEDELVEWRDDGLWMTTGGQGMRGNGFAIREVDGTPSSIIRFGPEVGLRIALNAIAEHLEAAS